MAVSCGARVDRPVQLQQLANAARREVEVFQQNALEFFFIARACAVGVEIDRQRLGNADGIGQLNRATIGQTGGNNVFGNIASGIGGGAVYLGRIFAGKGATAMRRGTTISVDDNLAPSQAGIPIGAADDKTAGRINIKFILLAHPALRQHFFDIRANQFAYLGHRDVFGMLRGDHNRRRPYRLAVLVLQGDLALGVGPELRPPARMPVLGHALQDHVGILDRRRHQLVGLVAGVAEHDALIAGAEIFVAAGVDTLGDVARLAVQADLDRGLLPMKTGLLVADTLHRLARNLLDTLAVRGDRIWTADLARQHDQVCGCQRLAGDAGMVGIGFQEQINDGIGNLVANFVRMPLGHGFTGK